MNGTSSRLPWSGYLLGFALGGFFDGILLHQILQWHHLLSAVGPEDVRFQVAADGYFHALMYAVAAIGLWLLATTSRISQRLLFATILVGFGLWHVVDAVLSHWVLGIHRIRMDTDNPLVWDVSWLAIFGLLPLVAGWLMRHSNGGDGSDSSRGTTSRALVALFVVGMGVQSLRLQGSEFTTVLFVPGTGQADVLRAIASVDGELVWTDRTGEVVVIRIGGDASGFRLFRKGAILVSGAGLPPGCFTNVRV